jgi:XTP/dITP diphosphohydrolase
MVNLMKKWKLNTSNKGKLKEFESLFAKYGFQIEATQIDLKEIDSDHLSVVSHKASQLDENVLVEDTSLEIEGASVGINVRWVLDHLSDFIGRKAEWVVLLAYRKRDQIMIFRGIVHGSIVEPRNVSEGFGFDPVFLPDGTSKTLSESKPFEVNARAKAVEALIKNDIFMTKPALYDWEGPWQGT